MKAQYPPPRKACRARSHLRRIGTEFGPFEPRIEFSGDDAQLLPISQEGFSGDTMHVLSIPRPVRPVPNGSHHCLVFGLGRYVANLDRIAIWRDSLRIKINEPVGYFHFAHLGFGLAPNASRRTISTWLPVWWPVC